jgi:hypothetical protein
LHHITNNWMNENKGYFTLWPCHLTLRNILSHKRIYGNSNISPCKNRIFKKRSSKSNQNPSRHHNSIN